MTSTLEGEIAADYLEELLDIADLDGEIDNDAQLNPDERKQLENLKSRQVTLR